MSKVNLVVILGCFIVIWGLLVYSLTGFDLGQGFLEVALITATPLCAIYAMLFFGALRQKDDGKN